MSRERDVRNAIRDNLVATGAFAGVWITGLPEDYGQGASELTAAAIEPVGSAMRTGWDSQQSGALEFAGSCTVTLIARHADAQLRDELAEQLLDYLNNAVNGQPLAGFTLPGKTLVTSNRWEKPAAPERRILATVGYEFLQAWAGFDVSQ